MGRPDLQNPELSLSEMLNTWPETAEVFRKFGMICVGCLIAPFHTVTEACAEYGLDEEEFRQELREAVRRGGITSRQFH